MERFYGAPISTAVLAILVLGGCASAQTDKSKPDVSASTIVLVCDHGSAKRVVAAAHFNQLASKRASPNRAREIYRASADSPGIPPAPRNWES